MPTSTTFEPQHAQQLLALLRESAPSLLSNVDDEQALGKTMQLEDLATRRMSYGGMRSANLTAARSPRVTNLLRAYVLAFRLRNKSTLRKVMVECFALAEVDEEQQNQWLQDSLKGTSAASLSRSQVFVDAALMRMVGLRYVGSCGPIYIWADSSPQHGTDWFLSLVATIHEADLDECMRCAHVWQTELTYSSRMAPGRVNACSYGTESSRSHLQREVCGSQPGADGIGIWREQC